MFLDESVFEESPSGVKPPPSKYVGSNVRGPREEALQVSDLDTLDTPTSSPQPAKRVSSSEGTRGDDLSNEFAPSVSANSQSKARILAQRRDNEHKKRSLSNGGMVRSSVDGPLGSGFSSPKAVDNQFTPSVRQFSAPKAVIDINGSNVGTEFGRRKNSLRELDQGDVEESSRDEDDRTAWRKNKSTKSDEDKQTATERRGRRSDRSDEEKVGSSRSSSREDTARALAREGAMVTVRRKADDDSDSDRSYTFATGSKARIHDNESSRARDEESPRNREREREESSRNRKREGESTRNRERERDSSRNREREGESSRNREREGESSRNRERDSDSPRRRRSDSRERRDRDRRTSDRDRRSDSRDRRVSRHYSSDDSDNLSVDSRRRDRRDKYGDRDRSSRYERDRDRDRSDRDRDSERRDRDRDSERRDRDRERRTRDHGDRDRERERRDREKDRERRDDKDREKDRERRDDKDREKDRERRDDKDREKDRERRDDKDRERRDGKDREKDRERRDDKDRERRRDDKDRERRRERRERERAECIDRIEAESATANADVPMNATALVSSVNPPASSPSAVDQLNQPRDPPNTSDMLAFLTSPVPRNCGVVQCYIRRGRHQMYPVYSVYLKNTNEPLMSAKKMAKSKTSNYHISTDQYNFAKDSPFYLGKLRSNFMGTEFQIFDNGVSPKDDGEPPVGTNASVRCELGCVMYAPNVLGARGPRRMQVALPTVDPTTGTYMRIRDGSGDLTTRIKERNFREIVYLINKPPRWNDQVGAYVLNFNGRVTMASVKNFQLVDPEEQDTVVLQFGRVGKDEFNMDMQWPMSPLQALAITLSSFDSKIACD